MHFQAEDSPLNPVPFEIQSEVLDDQIRAFTVRGELDLDTAPKLKSALDSVEDGASAMIDLSDCEFIDSTGIALLVSTWRNLEGENGEGDGRLVLCCLTDQVQRLMEITGVEASISTHEKRDDALAELRG